MPSGDLKRAVEALADATRWHHACAMSAGEARAVYAALRSREQDIERAVERAVGERLAQAIAAEREGWRTVVRTLGHGHSEEECPSADPECPLCAMVNCPHAEPLHFHHDGCPACYEGDDPEPGASIRARGEKA